jgi:hypothetical protein
MLRLNLQKFMTVFFLSLTVYLKNPSSPDFYTKLFSSSPCYVFPLFKKTSHGSVRDTVLPQHPSVISIGDDGFLILSKKINPHIIALTAFKPKNIF